MSGCATVNFQFTRFSSSRTAISFTDVPRISERVAVQTLTDALLSLSLSLSPFPAHLHQPHLLIAYRRRHRRAALESESSICKCAAPAVVRISETCATRDRVRERGWVRENSDIRNGDTSRETRSGNLSTRVREIKVQNARHTQTPLSHFPDSRAKQTDAHHLSTRHQGMQRRERERET